MTSPSEIDWVPTRRKFRGWSLPSRATYISALVGVVSLFLTVYGLMPKSKLGRDRDAHSLSDREDNIEPPLEARYEALGLVTADVRQLRHLFRDVTTLPAARAMLERLAASTKTRRQLDRINEFLNATYCGEKHYRDGLEFLGRITRDLPREDQRYRFLFHDQIRGLANEEGIPEAEQVVEEYRRKFRRDELSRVWIAIPNSMSDDLHDGKTLFDSPRQLPQEGREYLEILVRHQHSDPYIDHALYFLGAYADVVEQFPKSVIRDTAMRAWMYSALDCDDDPQACNLPLARTRFRQLVTEFPNFEEEARSNAGILLARAGRLVEAEAFACPRTKLCDRKRMLEGALQTGRARFGAVIEWLAPHDWKLLHSYREKAFEAFDESLRFARLHDYAAARDALVASRSSLAQHGIPAPQLLGKRLEAFAPLARFSDVKTASEIFSLGLAEANSAYKVDSRDLTMFFRERAVETFEKVETLEPRSELAAKACYLRAATLRRLQNHQAAYGVIEHFLEAHRGSPLYDDMLAEKGLYLKRVRDDDAAAAVVFESVAQQFPKGNAADNALTFLAEIRERQCRFAEAYAIDRRIARDYPYSRLGVAAVVNAQSLVPIVRSRRMRLGVPGLRVYERDGKLIVEVVPGSAIAKAGIKTGDKVRTVADTWVGRPSAFYMVTKAQLPGTTMPITFDTDAGVRLVTVAVQLTEYYTADDLPQGCGE